MRKNGAVSRIFAGNYCVSNPCSDEWISGNKGTADKYIVIRQYQIIGIVFLETA